MFYPALPMSLKHFDHSYNDRKYLKSFHKILPI